MSLLLDSMFSSVAFSHLIVDIMNGQRAVLFAFWSGPFGLTNSFIALISVIYVVSAAFAQPLFGWLSDKVGSRWLIAGGVFWMAVWFLVAIYTPNQNALIYMIISSLGSGAFHPAGAMEASIRGRDVMQDRETTATSLFFLFGQSGSFFGPLIGGPLLQRFGVMGLAPIAIIALPIGISAAYRLRFTGPRIVVPEHLSGFTTKPSWKSWSILTLLFVALFHSWVQQNMVTFVPKYMNDLGLSPSIYGILAALFMGGYALGNVYGGVMADKYGKRPVIMAGMGLGSIPLLLFAITGYTPIVYLYIPVAGLLIGAAFSVIVVLAQKLIPTGGAMASGLVLGFMFSSGSIGTLLSGYIADHYGFPPVFYMNAGIALASCVAAYWLSKDL